MISSRFFCAAPQLDLAHTVICGQAFRWHCEPHGWWSCILTTSNTSGQRRPYSVRLRREGDEIAFQISPDDAPDDLVRDYFRLGVDLEVLARDFAEADPQIAAAITNFPGLRVLRQDPTECLFSFICTSAAPLYRIRRNILGICRAYGESVALDGASEIVLYAFPTVEQLARSSVPEMMQIGLGYRARYIQSAARQVQEYGGEEWLLSLRAKPYAEAKAALMTLTGIGEKIADCVCLFSLDKDQAIPVDTHIRKIAHDLYLQTPIAKSLTRAGYQEIGDLLRAQFGPYAGWAQQYLFYQDLYQKGAWKTYEEQYRRAEQDAA